MAHHPLAERVQKGQVNRQGMLARFGFIPTSILRISRGALSRERVFSYQHENPERNPTKRAERINRIRKMTALGVNPGASGVRCGRGHGGLSVMPAELVDFFIKYYAVPGQVYLDPFMGQGVQMQIAKMRGLHYWGYDISREFFAYIEAVRNRIDDGKTTLSITCGDSRFPDAIPDGIGDFSFHSPPYWDIEFYGNEPEQLGTGHSYADFLAGMEDVARAWLPKFKCGAYHVVNVNDFRKDGRFYPYHADTIALYARAGWITYDTWIIDGLVGGFLRSFATNHNLKRMAPKVHEYALVFRAP